jgi:cytochrome c peroxidase
LAVLWRTRGELKVSRRLWIWSIFIFGFIGVIAWKIVAIELVPQPRDAGISASASVAETIEPISPIPESVPLDPRKVSLGSRLFDDPRLSGDNSVACSTCHALSKGGMDGLERSIGIRAQTGEINAPTVFNSGFNFKQFWNGRATSLEDQIDGPVQHAKEMNSEWPATIAKLNLDAYYKSEFAKIYPDGIQPASVKDAIATFERSLITPNSRFDRYLKGDRAALTREETDGYQRFKSYGCVACHQGVNVGGNMFERLGIMDDYFKDRGNITTADLGRFSVTGIADDTHVFKVPSLRNVALTAPYFHDGSASTLELAVVIMGKYQLGIAIPADDVALIVKFLRTLTGEYNGKSL